MRVCSLHMGEARAVCHKRGEGMVCACVCLCNETVMENRTGAVKCTYVKDMAIRRVKLTAKLSEVE